jgi:hypothetical protein
LFALKIDLLPLPVTGPRMNHNAAFSFNDGFVRVTGYDRILLGETVLAECHETLNPIDHRACVLVLPHLGYYSPDQPEVTEQGEVGFIARVAWWGHMQ